MIIYFDPASYTYHFNNNVVSSRFGVLKLYSSVYVERRIVKWVLFAKFYLHLTISLFSSRYKCVVFNISPLPFFDIPFLFLIRISGKKLILILHNLDPTKGGIYPLRAFGFRLSLFLFQKIIVHTPTELIFANYKFLQKFNRKLYFSHLPLKIKDFGFQPQLVSKNDSSELKLLFIGRIDQYKGIESLPPFFEGTGLKTPITLEIIGKQVYNVSGTLKKLKSIDFYNLKIVSDYVSACDYDNYLDNCDVVLLPYTSCTGSAIFTDSMSKGKIIIASDLNYFMHYKDIYSRIILVDFTKFKFVSLYDKIKSLFKVNVSMNKFVTFDDYFTILR